MKLRVITESGYAAALMGIGLSYGLVSNLNMQQVFGEDKYSDLRNKLKSIAFKLAYIGNGENKFLRQMQIWIDLQAPRFFWSEFDTYKIGTIAQSESTMHTIHKTKFTPECFENGEKINFKTFDKLNDLVTFYNNLKDKNLWREIKIILPESFLQRRIVNLNYAVLQNMLQQRYNHGLSEWHYFCKTIVRKVDHPEFILPRRKDGSTVDLFASTYN